MKKFLYLILVLSLSLTFVSCTKEQIENEKENEEETFTVVDENGVEFTYSKYYAAEISKAFSIIDKYTWEELKLFSEKDNYLWGPEENEKGIIIGDESVRTVVIHAGVQVINGDGTVMIYYVDTENERIYIRDAQKGEYVLLSHKN